MRGPALKVKLQLALFRFGNYNRILRQGELGAVLSSGFSEKYAVPLRAAGRHVVDVQNHFGETLVEDSGLHREGSLGSEQIGLEATVFVIGHRAEPERHAKRDESAGDGENAHGQENAAAADAQSRQGDDLAVRG